MSWGTLTLILILSPLILFSHHRRDELRVELQVAEVGELGGDEAQHGVLAVDVQPGDLGPQRHEGPQARVLRTAKPLPQSYDVTNYVLKLFVELSRKRRSKFSTIIKLTEAEVLAFLRYHVPFLADQGVGDYLAVGEVREDLQEDLGI